MTKFCPLIIIAFALSACTTHHQPGDLDFMRDQILENHPGVYNTLDPSFKDELEKAYSVARCSIDSASNPEQIKTALSTFAKSFNDAHLWINWNGLQQKDASKIASPKQQPTFTLKHIPPKITWIALPTLDINLSQQKDFDHIVQELPKIKTKGTIVFDIRGNQGGNSEYGDRVVDRLFGKNYANQQRRIAKKNISVDWRASPGNLAHIREFYARYKSAWIENVAKDIESSIAKHEPYYHASSDIVLDSKTLSHNVTAKIIVIIEPLNVSAALDFIDSLKMMNHPVILIGKTTKADRLYMEVRCVNLPSGLGTFSYPIKVYRNRPRGDNIPYIPDVECDVTYTKELIKCVKGIK